MSLRATALMYAEMLKECYFFDDTWADTVVPLGYEQKAELLLVRDERKVGYIYVAAASYPDSRRLLRRRKVAPH